VLFNFKDFKWLGFWAAGPVLSLLIPLVLGGSCGVKFKEEMEKKEL